MKIKISITAYYNYASIIVEVSLTQGESEVLVSLGGAGSIDRPVPSLYAKLS